MKRSIYVILTLVVATLRAQSVPPSAGELSYRLISPFYLGGGIHLTKTESSEGTYVNPAVAAGFQRTILSMNYTNLQGLGNPHGMGHAANLGGAFPTKVGVISASLGFRDTFAYSSSAMDLGRWGHLNLAFSKELYSDLWVGAGLTGAYGQVDGLDQGGVALNLGFLHFPAQFWRLKNFSWGGALSGLGYNYGSYSRSYLNAIPGNLTASAGAAFDIVDAAKFRWTLRSDLRFPSFTDLWFGIASDFSIGRILRFSLSSSFTVRDAIAGSWQTVIPSLVISLNFDLNGKGKKKDRLKTTELDVQLATAPLYADVWGFSGGLMLPLGVRDSNPPVAAVQYDSQHYVSPNYDGIQDEILIPYEVQDERYISGYTWKIVDSEGNTVRTFVNKDERPENETVKNLWSRLISPKKGTALPNQVRWDGLGDDGSPVSDGEYRLLMDFVDDNGNSSTAGPFDMVIDTKAPELNVQPLAGLELIFSPDGDGIKDVLAVKQSGSVEHLWESEVQNLAGDTVYSWEWADASPPEISWDGKNNAGEAVEDGVYRFVVKSTDLSGNSSESVVEGIIIDTQRPELGLIIDRNVFAPGTSSAISRITLSPDIPVYRGIIAWNLDILTEDGRSVRSLGGGSSAYIPESFDFQGRNNKQEILPEGRYSARLNVEYSNGYKTEGLSPSFIIDTTAPSAAIKANWVIFSPQGASRRDNVSFTQETSREPSWTGTLRDSDNNVVNRWSWPDEPPKLLTWDGRDGEGRLAADGTYSYILEAVDEAGNSGRSNTVHIEIDTQEVEVTLTASRDIFGPTGNGRKDSISFYPTSRTDSEVSDWKLTIFSDSDNNEIFSWLQTGELLDELVWDGRGENRRVAEDGIYRAQLVVNYLKGDSAKASTTPFMLDTKPPRIDVEIANKWFSPDEDGEKDTVIIRQDSSEEAVFNGQIFNADNQLLRKWVWTGKLNNFEWDGSDDSGNILQDGEYRYVVSSVDEAGNQSRREISGIKIDTVPTPVYLTAKEGYIKAGETQAELMQKFTALVPQTQGVESWIFNIRNEQQDIVITETGTSAVPDEFLWNGTDSNGQPMEGIFQGVLTVVYRKGSRPQAESQPFISDGSPPQLSLTLNPQPFSPDNDNVDDELVIGIAVEDRSRIAEWSLEIFNPRKQNFITFSGRGRPSERIIWDGRSGRGELVESAEDYPYVMTATDVLGYTSRQSGVIPVDVLVIREGQKLKILINNITFDPNSSNLTQSGEKGQKNSKVLSRLAEIMKKYASYRIVIEGHAVSLKWDNPAEAKREQENILLPLSLSRAQAVADALISRGIASYRLQAIGKGGEDPLVPHGDEAERWRNRRVEFYLEKE